MTDLRPTSKKLIDKHAMNDSVTGVNVKCDFSIAKDLCPVEVDEGQIAQVIHNLIINAKQAVPGGMGGMETMQKLLEIDPHVRAIVSSGYSDDAVMSNYTNYNFKGVVAKPYRIEELSRTVRMVLSETGK